MITAISLRNFGLHKDTNIEFGKVNILFGLNNTGKSSIIHALRLIGDYEWLKYIKETNTKEIKKYITKGEEYAEIEATFITHEGEEIKVKACIGKKDGIKISQEDDVVKKIRGLFHSLNFYEEVDNTFKVSALNISYHGIFELIKKLKAPEMMYKKNYGKGAQRLMYMFLPIVVAQPNETICLEEPENNLHQRVQYRLGKLLVEIANEQKKQFILTTHSEDIIWGFLNSVASGKIKKDDVFLYHFKRKKGGIKIRRKKINEYGQIGGGLEEFADVMREELCEMLNPSSQQKQNGISKNNGKNK